MDSLLLVNKDCESRTVLLYSLLFLLFRSGTDLILLLLVVVVVLLFVLVATTSSKSLELYSFQIGSI